MSRILSGVSVRDEIKKSLNDISQKREEQGLGPVCLAILQVGDNSSSNVYIKMKKRFGEEVGAKVFHIKLGEDVSQEEILEKIEELNSDKETNGILVQLPLPKNIDTKKVLDAIDPAKDVDGLGSHNSGIVIPATTRGILTLLNHYGVELPGKKVLVIGRSNLVGIPTALALIGKDATVTVAHSKTENLVNECLSADIIVSAVGQVKLVKSNMVKEGQIIIDVGISKEDGKIVGDVDFDEVFPIVAGVSPVPGGVGPLTVASLFQNLFDTI